MTSPNKNNAAVRLLPAGQDDVARIAEITANSLDATPASHFLFKPAVYRQGRRSAAVTAYFVWRTQAALDDPTAQVIKAVDRDSGKILGFATWQFVEKSGGGGGASSTGFGDEATEVPGRGGEGGESESEREPAIVKDVNMDLMRDYFTSTGHNQIQIANAIQGESSAYLWHLYVDPSTQQGGVGTMLMNWGLERVDAKGIASSVVSTPNAKDFYAKFGFVEISHADLDIAKVRGDLLGFGVWRQYGMLRKAATPASTS